VWNLTEVADQIRERVETAERFAEGGARPIELWRVAYETIAGAIRGGESQSPETITVAGVRTVSFPTISQLCHVPRLVAFTTMLAEAEPGLRAIELFRCIVGNPFRRIAFDPRWRTSDVLGLAEAIYADRAFDRLPILADAFQDAGCEHPDLLAHCRGPGPHARGCWVVDGVLGKA
jgi:hypothetical protein